MKIQLIRNATLRLNYAGHTLLIDPCLAPKHALPTYAGNSPNPLVDLPVPASAVIAGTELVLVSHLHGDHFDSVAQEMLPKELPIFCQPENEDQLREQGFLDVTSVDEKIEWENIILRRTLGQHGSSRAILRRMGVVSGFIFSAENEPTVYWAGDTAWYEAIGAVIREWQPEVIITHSGGAVWGSNELIIMDATQTVIVCQQAPQSTVVAVHLEALDHCLSSRADLRALARQKGISDEQLRIPADGETMEFRKQP